MRDFVSYNLSLELHHLVSDLDMESKQRALKIPYLPASVGCTNRRILNNICLCILTLSPYNLLHNHKILFYFYCKIILCFVSFLSFTSNNKVLLLVLDQNYVCLLNTSRIPKIVQIIFNHSFATNEDVCWKFGNLASLEIMNVVKQVFLCCKYVNTVFCNFLKWIMWLILLKYCITTQGYIIYNSPPYPYSLIVRVKDRDSCFMIAMVCHNGILDCEVWLLETSS
jgi:hypothetical protein